MGFITDESGGLLMDEAGEVIYDENTGPNTTINPHTQRTPPNPTGYIYEEQ